MCGVAHQLDSNKGSFGSILLIGKKHQEYLYQASRPLCCRSLAAYYDFWVTDMRELALRKPDNPEIEET